MVMFHSYIKLPEGKIRGYSMCCYKPIELHWLPIYLGKHSRFRRKVRPSQLAECESQRCLVGLKLRLVDGFWWFLYDSMKVWCAGSPPKLKWFDVQDPHQNWNDHTKKHLSGGIFWSILAKRLYSSKPTRIRWWFNRQILVYIFGGRGWRRTNNQNIIYSPEAARGYRKSVSACVSRQGLWCGTGRTLWNYMWPASAIDEQHTHGNRAPFLPRCPRI